VTSRRDFIATAGFGLGAAALGFGFLSRVAVAGPAVANPMNLTDADWRKKLTPVQYNILRHEGTEAPYTSALNDEHRKGVFACAGCATKAFRSETKFDSGTGWPSFYEPIPKAVSQRDDTSLGMSRTEVHCATCGGHLGHVFDDGPKPTGLRYCMNGAAMTFQPA
jgi:peptide-methionine (R)-S-oxide reductase